MATLTVQIDPQFIIPLNFVYTNSSIIKKLSLPLNQPFEISFGNKKTFVYARESNVKGNLIRVSANIAKLLLLPDGIKIQAKYYRGEGLKIGPLLGILVQSVQKNQLKTPFGKFTNFAVEVSEKSRAKGVIPYFFTADNLFKENDTISGWFYFNNKWEKKIFPFPDVIYNRISLRGTEEKLLPEIKKLQESYNFVFFNNNFLNKWEVHQILNQTAIRAIMPKTIKYKGNTTIKEMLKKYPNIYLKPTNGALGRGIIRIEKISNGYLVQYNRAQGPANLTFESLIKVAKYLNPRISSKSYLVQQGLNLIKLEDRPIDFRILVQKNYKGVWAVTSIVARIANDKQIVSNLAQGGTLSKATETIKAVSPDLAKKITITHFKNHSLAIAKHLEAATEGIFAELGIDLALDSNGKIWLLEVNSKPSKTEEQKENNEPRPSVNRLIQYVLFVSGF